MTPRLGRFFWIPTNSFFLYTPMFQRYFYSFMICALISSCAAHLPEFERIESLEVGEQRVAAGVFVGGIPQSEGGVPDAADWDPLSLGGALYHGIGVTNNCNWSTLFSFGAQTSFEKPTEFNLFSISTGPKITFGPNRALTLPVTYVLMPDDLAWIDGYVWPTYGITPTYYFRYNPWWYPKIKSTVFYRMELYKGLEEPKVGLTCGIRFEQKDVKFPRSINVNFSITGLYLGYTMDLFPSI